MIKDNRIQDAPCVANHMKPNQMFRIDVDF